MYRYEDSLVNDLVTNLPNLEIGNITKTAKEFTFTSGRADIIGKSPDNYIYAFEAKLIKWRIAVHQAFRNTSYAHYSYVALPLDLARRISKHRVEFEKRKVGLCGVSAQGIEVVIKAEMNEPILDWLTSNAYDFLAERQQENV